MSGLVRRTPDAVALGALVLLSAGARFAFAAGFDVPWIAPDEMIYGLVGQSLWDTGELAVRGVSIPYYSLLTPMLVGLPLTLRNLETGVAIAQVLQLVAMSLAAVPVYLWGRTIAGPRWALVAAGLALLPPALWYGGLLMTEALFYTLVVAALLALARTLERPTILHGAAFLLLVCLASAVRLQALVLLPTFFGAIALDAWFARSLVTARRLAPLVGLVAVSGVITALAYRRDPTEALGAYTSLGEAPPSGGLIAQLAWHSGATVVMTLCLPVLATAMLAVRAALAGEPDPALRTFLAATSTYVVLLVVQVSIFAAQNLDHVGERYLITAIPPLLVGYVAWIARGALRPPLVAVPLALVTVGFVATLPADRFKSVHDQLTLVSFVQRADPGDLLFRGTLVGAALVAAALLLVLPHRLLPVLTGALAVAFAAISVLAAREIDRFSHIEHVDAFGTTSADWIDSIGVSTVLVVDVGGQPWPSIARLTFWNQSVRQLVRLSDVESKGPIPETPVAIRDDGTVVDPAGRPVAAANVVVASSVTLAGERLDSTSPTGAGPGYGLWRADEPLRVVSKKDGFTPVGDFGPYARVTVYACGRGALELTLLGKQGLPITMSVNGKARQTIRPAPDTVWHESLASPSSADGSSPCVFELESGGLVGSTRVDWVPMPS